MKTGSAGSEAVMFFVLLVAIRSSRGSLIGVAYVGHQPAAQWDGGAAMIIFDRSGGVRPSAAIMLTLLTAAYVLSYVDRTIVTLLVGPIKQDLGISDTQFSLLHGLAFAIFYTTLGIPIGRLADRGNRKLIISTGIAIWSLMTALCGLSRTFWQFFGARVGVGVGEAALSPAAYSLITDAVPRKRLGRALAIYSTGIYLGSGVTYMAAGWGIDQLSRSGPVTLPVLGTLQPWQQLMLMVGLPGLTVALAVAFLLVEPRQTARDSVQGPRGSLRKHFRLHWRFLSAHFLGFSLLSLMFNGYFAWLPEFYVRSFHIDKTSIGFVIGSITLVSGVAGMLLGGFLTDWLDRRGDSRASMTAGLWGAVMLLPFTMLTTTANAAFTSFIGLAGVVFFSSMAFGPAVVALQLSSPERLRAQISAVYLFMVNVAGIGIGGTVIAAISDFWLRDEARIGVAMAIVGGVAVSVAVVALWTGRRFMQPSQLVLKAPVLSGYPPAEPLP